MCIYTYIRLYIYVLFIHKTTFEEVVYCLIENLTVALI